ncbi:MAG: GNAT family N-acetyltransferase [Bacillota bacterium]
MELRGKRVTLRTVDETDLDFLLDFWNNGANMVQNGWPNGLGIDRAYMDRYWANISAKMARTNNPLLRMVVLNEKGERIGEMAMDRIAKGTEYNPAYPVPRDRMGDMDIKLDHTTRGKGYGTDALRTMLVYGFDALDIDEIIVEPEQSNAGALRLYAKLGFMPQGVRYCHKTSTGMDLNCEIWVCHRDDFLAAIRL